MDLFDQLAGATGFDWDDGSAPKNWHRHHVTPAECEQVFFNAPCIVTPDVAHSGEEVRFLALGQTDAGRHLFIAFTLRGTLIRPISARDMSRRERAEYAKL